MPELKHCDKYEFKVDAEKKQVLCLISRKRPHLYDDAMSEVKVIARGIARAKGDDVFNEEDGKKLAAAKAYNNYLELDRKDLKEDLYYATRGLTIAKNNMEKFVSKKAKAKRVIAALKSRM